MLSDNKLIPEVLEFNKEIEALFPVEIKHMIKDDEML
jgi:hypothetical protein